MPIALSLFPTAVNMCMNKKDSLARTQKINGYKKKIFHLAFCIGQACNSIEMPNCLIDMSILLTYSTFKWNYWLIIVNKLNQPISSTLRFFLILNSIERNKNHKTFSLRQNNNKNRFGFFSSSVAMKTNRLNKVVERCWKMRKKRAPDRTKANAMAI